MPPTALYLHGFGSGPASHKGVWLNAHLTERGLPLRLMNLRLPSLELLSLSAILDSVSAAVGEADAPVLLLGSSLGGLAAAHVGAKNPKVAAVVLLAPAFGLARRWRAQNPEAIARWEATGWLDTTDYTTGRMTKVHHGFFRDMEAIRPETPSLSVLTLILHGRGDETVPVEHSRDYAAAHPNVRLVELDDGHELVTSLPIIGDEVTRFLAPWLSVKPPT